MPSVLNVDTLVAANGTDPVTLTKQSAAKAFFYFDGTGTPAILSSENGSSITDIGTGNYEPNVVSSFSSVVYCVNLMSADNNAFQVTTYEDGTNESNRTASKFRMSVVNLQTQPGVRADSSQINVLIHGDLA